ncbi:methyl-accepting chemotaxis protein [Sporomusaceae bacterium BoRhaA]|uniref:methyl-accepting chemotaxis protein n=1 Tax=Pelorhabdus rhamnosifermentans TaxID=2772457 RepID=UPI001C062A9C|nr:methyl-accepting chemotaxis protein [Pelorhabdus rhamnosifermentans]MBU2701481.1 methyl-accepting chemotaxis protein [Pelorhabdus rhamnosifermentans]
MKSIQTKLTLMVLSIVVASMCTLGGLNYWRAESIVSDNITTGMKASAESNAKDISNWLETRKSELTLLAALPAIESGVLEDITPILQNLAKENNDYLLISYVDPQGIAFTSQGAKLNVAERDYFQQAISGKPFISDPMIGKSTGRPLTVIAIPVKKDNQVTGVVYGAIDMGTIEKNVLNIKIGQTGYAFIVQGDGLRIIHPDKEQAMKFNPLADTGISSEEKNLNERMIKGEVGISRSVGKGNDKFVAYAPIGGVNWSIVLEVPVAEMTGVLSSLTTISFITIIAVLIVSGLFVIWLARRIAKPIQKLELVANRIADGDISETKVHITSNDEIGRLGQSFEQMAQNLQSIIRKILGATEQVAAASQELTASSEQSSQAANQIATSITNVATGTNEQMDAANDTTRVVEQMSASIQQIAANANQVAEQSAQAAGKAKNGDRAVEKAVTQMIKIEETVTDSAQVVTKLGERSKEIGQIVDTISGIAGQTNLLALNAAIEAARAGEQGRGFAVVAEEVRKLAEQSQEAAKKIAELIGEIQGDTGHAVIAMNDGTREVKLGAEVVNIAGATFREIANLVAEVSSQVREISAAIQQMASGSQRIVDSVKKIDNLGKKSASESQGVSAAAEEQLASMEEIASSSQALAKLAQDLQSEVNEFRI